MARMIVLKVRQVRLANVIIECSDDAVLDWIESALNDSFRDAESAIDSMLDEAEVEHQIEVERRYDY